MRDQYTSQKAERKGDAQMAPAQEAREKNVAELSGTYEIVSPIRHIIVNSRTQIPKESREDGAFARKREAPSRQSLTIADRISAAAAQIATATRTLRESLERRLALTERRRRHAEEACPSCDGSGTACGLGCQFAAHPTDHCELCDECRGSGLRLYDESCALCEHVGRLCARHARAQ